MTRSEIYKYLKEYKVNRNIKEITVHCSATKPGANVSVDVIGQWHKARGFSKQKESGHFCGYHFLVTETDGIQIGRFLNEIGAHVAGANSQSIGVCYAGGLDANGKAADTRTKDQKDNLIFLLSQLVVLFPNAVIKGHRDHSPDLDGDGIIEPWEWIKECPCFDAIEEYKMI